MTNHQPPDNSSPLSRRDFLRAAGRWLGGGLLLGGMGWLMGRNGVDCGYQGACGACPRVFDCSDERAAVMRDELDRDRAWKTSRKS